MKFCVYLNIYLFSLSTIPKTYSFSLTWGGPRCLLIDVLLVEEEHDLEIVELLAWLELIKLILLKSHLVELGALLLELLVLVADHLTLFLELVPEQILQVLP